MPALARCIGMAVAFVILAVPPANAQNIGVVQSDILVLDTERLFAETLLGKRMTDEYQAARDELIAKNRQLEAELEAEEQSLTVLRAEKTPEEFRELADAFDTKVQQIREDSERRVRDLERGRELAPINFMRMAEPVLAELMDDANGSVILDKRSALFSAGVIDITDLAIVRVDAAIGEGAEKGDLEPNDGTSSGEVPDEVPQTAE